MAERNRRDSPARMRTNNPMFNPEVKERAMTTLRNSGKWKPSVRGGNGKALPVPQQLLAVALGWPTEHAVPTGMRFLKIGHPTCYKIDIANPILKVAIEVDGRSHHSRKAQDARKTSFLESLGWTVLRFSNQEVTEHLEDCVQMVLSTISKLKKTTTTSQTES